MGTLHTGMKRVNFSRLMGRIAFVMLAGVAVPVGLMGLISMPSKSQAVQVKDGIVNLEVLMQKVLKLNKEKKHQEAMDLLMAAMEKNQDDALLRALLVQTFELFLDDEIHFGQQEIQENKHNINAYVRVAGAIELLGDNFRAMEVLINGVSLNPNAPELWMKIGKLEHKSERDDEALDIFKEVIRLDPKSSDAYNNAAFVLTQNEKCGASDLQLAEGYAQMARKLDPKNPDYIDTLAEVHFRKGNPSLAQSLIREAIKLAPERDFYKNQLRKFTHREPVLFE